MAFEFGVTEFIDRKLGTRLSRTPRNAQVFPLNRDQFAKSRTGGQILGTREDLRQSIDPRQSFNRVITTPSAGYAAPIGPQPAPATTSSSRARAPRQATQIRTRTNALDNARNLNQRLSGLRVNATNRGVDPNQAILDEINQRYGINRDYLSGLQSSYEAERDRSIAGVDDIFAGERAAYETGRNDLLAQNQARREQARLSGQNALDEAKLLYSELAQANRQRYGGTSSAGELAGALQGREFQRQQSGINQATERNIQELNLKDAEIERGYQAQLAQLESTKQQYIQNLRSQFDQKLREMDNSRLQNEDQKAQDRLQLLRDINARAQEIEDYIVNLQDNLNAQAITAKQNLYGAYQEYLANAGQAPDLEALPVADFSTVGGYQSTPDVQLPQGFYRKLEDESGYTPTGLYRPDEELITG